MIYGPLQRALHIFHRHDAHHPFVSPGYLRGNVTSRPFTAFFVFRCERATRFRTAAWKHALKEKNVFKGGRESRSNVVVVTVTRHDNGNFFVPLFLKYLFLFFFLFFSFPFHLASRTNVLLSVSHFVRLRMAVSKGRSVRNCKFIRDYIAELLSRLIINSDESKR